MAIERYQPERKDLVIFQFLTKEEGREALRMAVDIVAGECGDFTLLPPAMKGNDIFAQRGYVGFALCGETNALAALTSPIVRAALAEGIHMSDEELRSILSPHLPKHGWFKRTTITDDETEDIPKEMGEQTRQRMALRREMIAAGIDLDAVIEDDGQN